MITGGLGFIGSNLAHKLVKLGAEVVIMDCCLDGLGANHFNLKGIEEKVDVHLGDIREMSSVKKATEDVDIIFDLAAQVDYIKSNTQQTIDKEINVLGHENVLETVKNKKVRYVFPGSRTQYGKISLENLPVKEDHPLAIPEEAPSVYTANKTRMEAILKKRNESYGLDYAVLRLTNPYGPRAQIKNPAYCVLNWFISQAINNRELIVYGNGEQLRDYIFIDDAVEALATVGITPRLQNRVFNIGSGKCISFKEMAERVVQIAGSGKVSTVSYPKDRISFETWHFCADISKAKKELGWEPKTEFKEGLRKTVEFYKQNLGRYI